MLLLFKVFSDLFTIDNITNQPYIFRVSMKLVIVESPTKCKTIKRYLGDGYNVIASKGHIRDLAVSGPNGFGIDVKHNFKPKYISNAKQEKNILELKKASKDAEEIILATDPDREGEAIAWHLAKVLGLDIDKNKRLEFHEITRESLNNAISNPRTINMDLVYSQEARRIIDRILGFKLSSLLKKNIHSESAGRVQSATLKMIYDHQNEIAKFVPEEYWNVLVNILFNENDMSLTYSDFGGKYKKISNEKDANLVLSNISSKVKVIDKKISVKTTSSPLPFTTSSLQQEAFSKLGFSTKKTQMIAQKLYEGIETNEGHVGFITYMRTDSTHLSSTYVERAKAFIKENYPEYLNDLGPREKKAALSQDAHEAIRPTSNHATPLSVRKYLNDNEYKLYELIYNRALGSLMKPKKENVLNVSFASNDVHFKAHFKETLFLGFEVLYSSNKPKTSIPSININDEFSITSKKIEKKFTLPPELYTEGKIVKLMEEKGIGRPSTYATTIDTLIKRGYVSNNKGSIAITEKGNNTARVLNKYFPKYIEEKYTKDMEDTLDKIQQHDSSRNDVLNSFYDSFIADYNVVNAKMYKDEKEQTGENCPLCGSPLVYNNGKSGKFIGCSNYPHCRYTVNEKKEPAIETGEKCPLCGSPLVYRFSKKSHEKFIGCSTYPKCKYLKSIENNESIKTCPECGGNLVKRKGKFGYFLACSNYPKCKHMEKYYFKKKSN